MQKICARGLNWFQIYNYKGDVRQCGWTKDGYIGNLQENTVKEVYHSSQAEKIRKRLLKGDYSLCNIDACPFLAMKEINKNLLEYEETPEYPTELYLGFERVCNYACTSCTVHKCMIEEKNEDLEKYYAKIEERIQPLLPHIKKISANGCGELFCSKHTLNILANWKPLGNPDEIEVLLESNGSLFDEEHWKQIENLGRYNLKVAITVMSFDEGVYQYLSGTGLPVSKVENNLKFIKLLREKGIVNFFQIATVVQEQNFRMLPDFVRKCIEEYNPDYIRLRPYESWGAQTPEEVWLTDIRNPQHPYYNEYKKVMRDPILKHPLVHDWSGGLDTVKKTYFPYKIDYYKLKIVNDIYENFEAIEQSINLYTEDKNIILYGMAVIGKALIQRLLGEGYSISYIIDQNYKQKEYNKIQVYSLKETMQLNKESLVIVTPIVKDKQIIKELLSNGYRNVVSIKQLLSDEVLKQELRGI